MGGVVVGTVLGFLGALVLRKMDQDWQESRWKFEREVELARNLDDVLVETQRNIHNEGARKDGNRWSAASLAWQDGAVRVMPFMTSDELRARFQSVGTILRELVDYEGQAAMVTQISVAHRAAENARLGLAYFVRGETIPPTSFPASDELIDLLGVGDPDPLRPDAPLRKWLKDNPAPQWYS